MRTVAAAILLLAAALVVPAVAEPLSNPDGPVGTIWFEPGYRLGMGGTWEARVPGDGVADGDGDYYRIDGGLGFVVSPSLTAQCGLTYYKESEWPRLDEKVRVRRERWELDLHFRYYITRGGAR